MSSLDASLAVRFLVKVDKVLNVDDTSFLIGSLVLALFSLFSAVANYYDHREHTYWPSAQIMSLRIITLAPVYALLSWCMMVWLPAARFIEVIRDVYETYSLYCFWILLVLWCGGQREVTSMLGSQDGLCYLCPLCVPIGAGIPFRRFRATTGHFYYWRWATLQHIVFKPLVSLAIAVLKVSGHTWKFERLRFLALLSTAVAMHAVLDTYMRLFDQLKGFNSEKKFLGIKIVVWITTGQQVFLSSLVSSGALPDMPDRDLSISGESRAQRLLSFLIIVEMALFGIMLSYLFSRHGLTGKKPASRADLPRTASGPSIGTTLATGNLANVRERGLEGGKGVTMGLDGRGDHMSIGGDAGREGDLEGAMPDGLPPYAPTVPVDDITVWEVLACWDVVLSRRVEDPHVGNGAPGGPGAQGRGAAAVVPGKQAADAPKETIRLIAPSSVIGPIKAASSVARWTQQRNEQQKEA